MIGGYLMPDLSRNLVHLRWLLKLIDFRAAGELSWRSAVLATLYQEMCRATPPNKAKIGCCLSLLQSWARFHFSFLCPRVNHLYTFPLITSYVGIPTALEDIWLLLDQRSEEPFQWTPYEDPAIRAIIPEEFFQNPSIWHVKVPLVNYATVEIHPTDRVLQQFEFRQPIPETRDDQHRIDLWQTTTNWPVYWSKFIKIWENRYDHIADREPIVVPELACTLITYHSLGSMASHICCQKSKGVGKTV
ncbi:hypothetical protein CXB51_019559 [Gossypium anomalum]|uniref:Aminotransferase-like plant mobile domain-containing protein n=1 Tax=Gossypium anomalum TaxID=47600 RepID=A0A8J5YAI2_9ROSI|nr:hypothetical protein CXB51_019559 [Gossypium anomalum]